MRYFHVDKVIECGLQKAWTLSICQDDSPSVVARMNRANIGCSIEQWECRYPNNQCQSIGRHRYSFYIYKDCHLDSICSGRTKWHLKCVCHSEDLGVVLGEGIQKYLAF